MINFSLMLPLQRYCMMLVIAHFLIWVKLNLINKRCGMSFLRYVIHTNLIEHFQRSLLMK